MEHPLKVLVDYINDEIKRCNIAIKALEESPNQELWKRSIENYHNEISTYQSFLNKLPSLLK